MKLKKAILERLNPYTYENHLAAREQLSLRSLRDGAESIDKLARDLEKLLHQASPQLLAETCETELRFHLINSLLDIPATSVICGHHCQGTRTSIDIQ